MKQARKALLPVILSLAATAVVAAPKAPEEESLPPGAVYRYYSESGRLIMTNVLPREAIYLGYEVIDSKGRVLKTIEKAIPEEQRLAQQEELKAQRDRERKEAELRKLYASPDDAIRARDRQIDTLNLSITYARNTISQLEEKLNGALEQAASFEKQGKPVPEATQATIENYTRQIQDEESGVVNLQKDILSVQQQFAPIIQQLEDMQARAKASSEH